MKDKTIIIIIIIVFLILIGIQQYFIITDLQVDKNDILLEKIEMLESKIDSINNKKDSIRIAIDSTHVKIITNEKHYQERVNTILIQPASADSSFVSDYIRQYADKNSLSNIE